MLEKILTHQYYNYIYKYTIILLNTKAESLKRERLILFAGHSKLLMTEATPSRAAPSKQNSNPSRHTSRRNLYAARSLEGLGSA